MTLLDIKNHLIGHFLAQSTFSVRDHLAKVRMGAAYDEALDHGGVLSLYKEPLFRAALEEMTKGGILLKLDEEEGLYILNQPVLAFSQAVPVSAITAHLVAELINHFAPLIGVQAYTCNKLAITDADLNAVTQICLAFKSELDDVLAEMEDGGDGDHASGYGAGDN